MDEERSSYLGVARSLCGRQWRQSAKIALVYDAPIPAPISRGDVLGKLVVSGQGVPTMEVPLKASAERAMVEG